MAQAEVESALRSLIRKYLRERRACRIVRKNDGFVIELVGSVSADLAARLRPERSFTLARPQLEVLSIVAYRQPVSAEQIQTMIGSEPAPILRQLLRRQLIGTLPASDDDPATIRYATTARFLDVFGLASLADLPASADLQEL